MLWSKIRADEFSLQIALVLIIITSGLPVHEVTSTSIPNYQSHDGISIVGDMDFTRAKGVVAGNGTVSNPYIIEGWEITSSPGLAIRYTSVFFIVRNVYVHGAGTGVQFIYVNNGQLVNSKVSSSNGVSIQSSNYSVIANNTISNNSNMGLLVFDSRYLNVSGNLITENAYSGVNLRGISDIRLSSNKIFRNAYSGIAAESSNLLISDNIVSSNNEFGIWLGYNGNINVTGNSIIQNSNGIVLATSTGTVRIFHNNIVQNSASPQAFASETGVNIWDGSYPTGGNYWSDYTGADNCSGPAQKTCNGADGIGDIAYRIDALNFDHYPRMEPWGRREAKPPTWSTGTSLNPSEVGPFSLTLNWTAASDETWVAKYRLYEGTKLVAELLGTAQRYAVNDLLPATTYFFKIEAGDPWNNWSTNGPALTVITPDIPPLPPPQPGPGLFYRITFSRGVHQGESVALKNEFWNIGEASLRIASVTMESDLGNYTIFSANPQSPTACGNTYSGTLDVNVGQGRTLNATLTVPSNANIGNHTITASVGWQYFDHVQNPPYGPPVAVYCDAPPLVLQIWAQVQPNSTQIRNPPPPTQNPPPNQPRGGTSTGPFSTALLPNWIKASIPFAVGIYSVLVVAAAFLLIRARRRTHRRTSQLGA